MGITGSSLQSPGSLDSLSFGIAGTFGEGHRREAARAVIKRWFELNAPEAVEGE